MVGRCELWQAKKAMGSFNLIKVCQAHDKGRFMAHCPDTTGDLCMYTPGATSHRVGKPFWPETCRPAWLGNPTGKGNRRELNGRSNQLCSQPGKSHENSSMTADNIWSSSSKMAQKNHSALWLGSSLSGRPQQLTSVILRLGPFSWANLPVKMAVGLLQSHGPVILDAFLGLDLSPSAKDSSRHATPIDESKQPSVTPPASELSDPFLFPVSLA
jgi:hypothetical protein